MSTVEETILYLPILEDGVATLGDLWDCRESIAVGSLFDSPLTSEDAIASPTQSHKYTLSRIKSAKDILDEMHIDVSLKLEALGGAFKFNGSVGFDREGSQKYSEEELRCVYETETYQIRFSNFNKVSQLVRQKIKQGEIIATHFVETIILGGRAEATVCFSQNYNYSHLDLKGELGGTISLGAVTGSARVSLEMLDTELSDKYSTNITATAQPRLPVAPVDVASMFEAFDNFDTVVKGECHFQYLQKGNQRIEGVPIKFRLLPIATLFAAEDPIPSDYTYLLMDAVLEGAVQDALIILRDFSNKEHVKRLIWEKVPGVQVIFDNAKHPLTQEIVEWGTDLGKIAAKIMREAKAILKDYRFAKVTSADIAAFLERFHEEFAMYEVIQKIEDLQKKSREELKSINSHDVVGLSVPIPNNATAQNQRHLKNNRQSSAMRYRAALKATPTSTRLSKRKKIRKLEDEEDEPEVPEVEPDSIPSVHFITSQDELKLWFDKGTSTKFLMQVAQPAEDSPIFNKSKILLQLYEMSKFLHTIDGELGILLPSISENYSLTIKTRQSSKVYENVTEIQLLIEIVTASLQQDMNALKIFFILAGEVFGLNFPLKDAVDLTKFFDKVKTIRDPTLLLNQSLPEFKANLESNTETISLVFPIMASNAAYEQFSLFMELQTILKSNTDYKFSWHLPNLPKEFGENGPLLIGVRGIEPLFVCFCSLDVAVLKNLIQENSSIFEPLLINEIISGCIYSEQVQYLFKFIASISPTLPLPPPPPVLFPAQNNSSIVDAMSTLSAAASRSFHTIYNQTALLSLKEVGILLEDLLRNQGIIAGDITRSKFESIDWATLLEELEKLRSMLTGTISSLDLVLKDIKDLDSEMEDDQMETELIVIVGRIKLIVDEGSEGERDLLEALLKEVEREIKDEKLHEKRSRITRALEAVLFLLGSAKEFFYINHLVSLTKDLAETGTLAQSISAIVTDHIEKMELDEDIYFKEIEELNKALGDGKFYLGLAILSDISESEEHFQINKSLNGISTIGDKKGAKELLEAFGKIGLPKEVLQMLFSYPPLVYCITALKENPEIVSAMTSLFSASQYKVMENESELIFSQLSQFSSLTLKTTYQMPEVFASVTEYMGQLKTAIARNEIHDNFLLTLIKSIESNKKFGLELMEKDALPYFDKSSGLFEYPWHLEAIKYSFQKLEEIRNDKSKVQNMANVKTFSKIKSAPRQIILHPSWSPFSEENQLPNISDDDLFNIADQYQRELSIPDFQASQALSKIFQVMIPTIKFNDKSTLTPSTVAKWIETQQGQNLSRSDVLVAFLKSAFESPLLLHVALKSLASQFYAIPLIIQDIELRMEGKYLSFIEPLKSLNNPPISINAANILVLRIGDSSPKIGKSSYLNSSLLKLPAFSSKNEPGGEKGRPIARSGLLELVRLNTKITKSKIGNSKNVDINLLNLHGDPLATNWPLEAIKLITLSGIVVFWSVKNIAEFTQKKELLLSRLNEEKLNISDIILHPQENFEPTIPSTNILYREQIEENMEKVVNIFQTMAKLCSPSELCLEPSTLISNPEMQLESENAAAFLNILQTLSIPRIKAEMIKDAKNRVILNEIAEGFMQLLQVETDSASLFNSLVHIAYVLDNWSKDLSEEVLKKMEKLLQEIVKGPGDFEKFEPWHTNLLKELSTCRMDYSHTTLKITDIFEVVYQKYHESNLFFEFYTNILYKGFPVQILNGKEDGFGLNPQTFKSLSNCLKDKKIFVVSIVGYQNSGKSRLVHKLFGTTFQETVATSGIVLSLHELPDNLKTKYQLDHILVLDPSGLSYKNSIEVSQKFQEIQQTAFLISISNLVLVNVLEDNFKGEIQYLQEVLETSLVLASTIIENEQNPQFLYITQRNNPSKVYIPPLDIPNMCANIRSFIENQSNQLQNTASKEFLAQLEREVLLDIWNIIVDSSDSDKYEEAIYNLRSKIFLHIMDGKGEKRDSDLWLRNVSKSIQLVASSPFEIWSEEGIFQIENYLKANQMTKEIKACMNYALLQHVELIDVYFQNKLIQLINEYDADFDELKRLLSFVERELLETFQLCKGKVAISKTVENENGACGDCLAVQELLENKTNIQQINDYAMIIRKIEYRRYFRIVSEKVASFEDNEENAFKVDSKQSIISPMESILIELSHVYPTLKTVLQPKLPLNCKGMSVNLENIKVTNLLQFLQPQKINGRQNSYLMEAIHSTVDEVLNLQHTTIGDGIRTYTGVTATIQELINNLCARFEKKFYCKMEPSSFAELIIFTLLALKERMGNVSKFQFRPYEFQY